MKNKPYGIKVTDITGGTYKRWFSGDGTYENPTEFLLALGRDLDELSLKKAIEYVDSVSRLIDLDIEILYEHDFKKQKK